MVSATQEYPRAEEALRLLATAAGAARLYPAASALPAEAVATFTTRANAVVGSQGPLRYSVNSEGFEIGEHEIAAGNSQVAALAKSLHALQVGQLLIAPGLTEPEAAAFVAVANADPAAVRARGGARALLAASHVAHIAVVEVSLRASEEEGLLGVDLMAAPLDDIAQELEKSAERWAQATGPGDDDVATAISRMEAATREVAVERVSAALMRLDEPTRMRVLGLSLKADSNGRRMEGMLGIIASMKPAALARLLKLVALQAGTDPRRIAGALQLPPETAHLLAEMLAPGPGESQGAAAASGTEPPPALELARLMAEPDDVGDLNRQVAVASPSLSASRALATAVAVSRKHADAETVSAIGDSLPQAVRDGAFPQVREALRRLDELALWPGLLDAVASAKATLSEPETLAYMCSAIDSEGDAAIAGEILAAAGPKGAEVLLDAYITRRRPHARSAAAGAARHERAGPGRRAHPASHRAAYACDRDRAHAHAAGRPAGRAGDGAGPRPPGRERALRGDQCACRDARARGGQRADPCAGAPRAGDPAFRRARDRPRQGGSGDTPAHARARGPQRAPAHARDEEGSHPSARTYRHARGGTRIAPDRRPLVRLGPKEQGAPCAGARRAEAHTSHRPT